MSNEANNEVDIYGLSDEAFAAAFDELVDAPVEPEVEQEAVGEPVEDFVDEAEESTEDDVEEVLDESEELSETDEEVTDAEEESEESETDDQEDSEEDETEKETTSEIPEEFQKLFAPIKAGGREIKIDNIDEAISFIQKGIDYSDKVRELKDSRKYLQMLQNNDLLDEDKLSFLLDLNAKDPKAIAKLIADSNINPLDIDPEQGSNYTNTGKHKVSESSIALNDVVSSIESTPGGKEFVDDVGNNWDKNSLVQLGKNPEVLRHLKQHKDAGIFDMIQNQVYKERILGRLDGISDLDAYKAVGDRLHEAGQFKHLTGENSQPKQSNDLRSNKVDPSKAKPAKTYNKKSAVIGRSKAKKTSTLTDVWGMSDEDFEREFSKL